MLENEARRVAFNTDINLEQLVASKRQMLAKVLVARSNNLPAPFLAHRSLRLFDLALKMRCSRRRSS